MKYIVKSYRHYVNPMTGNWVTCYLKETSPYGYGWASSDLRHAEFLSEGAAQNQIKRQVAAGEAGDNPDDIEVIAIAGGVS